MTIDLAAAASALFLLSDIGCRKHASSRHFNDVMSSSFNKVVSRNAIGLFSFCDLEGNSPASPKYNKKHLK